MGLFGSTKIYVSSSVQNLAGDELKRPNYLKTTVIGSVLADQEDIADTLRRSYLKGPGMKLRSFFRWARSNYDYIGMPTSKIGHSLTFSGSVVSGEIPTDAGQTAMVQTVEAGLADFSYWADQWMLENHNDEFESDWTSDYNETTGDIMITFEDTSIATFTPVGFDKTKSYIYASYIVTEDGSEGSIVPGTVHGPSTDPFPDNTGWALVTEDDTDESVTRSVHTVVVVTYSDGSPGSTTTTDSGIPDTADLYTGEYTKEVYEGTDSSLLTDDTTYKTVYYRYLTQDYHLEDDVEETSVDEDMGGGVTKTTNTTVTTQVIVYDRSWHDDTQEVILKKWTGPYVYIYQIGSGNPVLDALVEDDDGSSGTDDEFFPFIPIRLDNHFISESYYPDAYELAKKGLKRAVDGKFDDIVESINSLDSLPDIDYSYVVFGVSVNVLENSCRKYLYLFFKQLSVYQQTNIPDYNSWKSDIDDYNDSVNDWLQWKEDQTDILSSGFGDDEPAVLPYPTTPLSKFAITTSSSVPNNYDIEISWQGISETDGSGLAKPDAKVGELWFETVQVDNYSSNIYFRKGSSEVLYKNIAHVRLYWQISATEWKALDIVGMTHKNFIYRGKYVEITLLEGLDDTEDSGFIVPLHYPTIKSMSLVDTTQMSTACTFMVFNSYVVKKTGIFGSLFFKIFLIVVIIAVIVFAPQLAPALVHAAAATGAAVGLTGVTALIVGAAVNAIAAMVLTSIIMKAAVAVFGEKLGLIIGTIISVVAMNGLQNLANGQGFTINFGNILSAKNLTMLTSTVGNVYAKLVSIDTAELMQKTQDLVSEYDKKSKQISDLYAQNFGYGNGTIDPLALINSTEILIEQPNAFLARTLLTGSDIADMSISMLGEFAAITLSNDLPLDY